MAEAESECVTLARSLLLSRSGITERVSCSFRDMSHS